MLSTNLRGKTIFTYLLGCGSGNTVTVVRPEVKAAPLWTHMSAAPSPDSCAEHTLGPDPLTQSEGHFPGFR